MNIRINEKPRPMPKSHIVQAQRGIVALTKGIEVGSRVRTTRAQKFCPVYFVGTVKSVYRDGKLNVEGEKIVPGRGRPYSGQFSPQSLERVD